MPINTGVASMSKTDMYCNCESQVIHLMLTIIKCIWNSRKHWFADGNNLSDSSQIKIIIKERKYLLSTCLISYIQLEHNVLREKKLFLIRYFVSDNLTQNFTCKKNSSFLLFSSCPICSMERCYIQFKVHISSCCHFLGMRLHT